MDKIEIDYTTPEGKEELFSYFQQLFEKIYNFAIYRRDAEDFLGMDVQKDNAVLKEIIDRFTKKLTSILSENGEVIDEKSIITIIDSLLELINFETKKGTVDKKFLDKIQEACHNDNKKLGEVHAPVDRLVTVLSNVEVALETLSGQYLNMLILGLNAYLSQKMREEDEIGSYEPEKIDHEARLNLRAIFTNVPNPSPQLRAGVNRMRSKIMAVGILFATLNVFTDRFIVHPHQQDTVMEQKDSGKNAKDLRDMLDQITSFLRIVLATIIIRRLIKARVNQYFIDYAAYLLLKLGEFDEADFDPKRVKPLRGLFMELQEELRKMQGNPEYDPSVVIQKIREGVVLLGEGQDIHVKEFLKDTRKTLRQSSRKGRQQHQKNEEGTQENSSAVHHSSDEQASHPVILNAREKVFQTTAFRLSPIKKELTREQRKELYAKQKALEMQRDQQVQLKLQQNSVEQAPAPTPATNPTSPHTQAVTISEQVETLTDREKTIQKISFLRMLDRAQFKSFLGAMGFVEESGGKGSHEKHVLKVETGQLMVILSQNFETFGDPAIKSSLLKKQPEINPQWVYWVYCNHFKYIEAQNAYEEFFGEKFDPQKEPPQI